MRLYLTRVCGFLLFIVSCAACSISNDEDRCSGIYKWNPATASCSLISTDDSAVETETQSSSDAGDNDGGDSLDADSSPQGLGDSCSSTKTCTAMDERLFCISAPDNSYESYCTYNCTSLVCPLNFVCCTSVIGDIGSFCMKETEYKQIGASVCSSK